MNTIKIGNKVRNQKTNVQKQNFKRKIDLNNIDKKRGVKDKKDFLLIDNIYAPIKAWDRSLEREKKNTKLKLPQIHWRPFSNLKHPHFIKVSKSWSRSGKKNKLWKAFPKRNELDDKDRNLKPKAIQHCNRQESFERNKTKQLIRPERKIPLVQAVKNINKLLSQENIRRLLSQNKNKMVNQERKPKKRRTLWEIVKSIKFQLSNMRSHINTEDVYERKPLPNFRRKERQ